MSHTRRRACAALAFLLGSALCLAGAPPSAKTVVIAKGKPTPQNTDVVNRKTDTVYFQSNDAEYKIVWTDKFYGSPFAAPGTPPDKATITVKPFAPAVGPFRIHDLSKPGQRYTYDLMGTSAGKTTRLGNGSVIVE